MAASWRNVYFVFILHICKVRVVIYSLFVRVIVSVIEVMNIKVTKVMLRKYQQLLLSSCD